MLAACSFAMIVEIVSNCAFRLLTAASKLSIVSTDAIAGVANDVGAGRASPTNREWRLSVASIGFGFHSGRRIVFGEFGPRTYNKDELFLRRRSNCSRPLS